MRLTRLIPTLLTVCAAAALATEATTEYTATEAGKHIGENATVTDKVARVNVAGGGNVFIDLGGAHPNAPFTVFISAKVADQFPDVKSYNGKTISVTGKITTHKDKPEISVTAPSQITVKDEAAAAASVSPSPAAAATSSPSPSPRK